MQLTLYNQQQRSEIRNSTRELAPCFSV